MKDEDLKVEEEVLYVVEDELGQERTGFLLERKDIASLIKRTTSAPYGAHAYQEFRAHSTVQAGEVGYTFQLYEASTEEGNPIPYWGTLHLVTAEEVLRPARQQSRYSREERHRRRELAQASVGAYLKAHLLHQSITNRERAMRERFQQEAFPLEYAQRYLVKHQEAIAQDVLNDPHCPLGPVMFFHAVLDKFPPLEREQLTIYFATLFLQEEKIRSTVKQRKKAYQASRGTYPLAVLRFEVE